MNYFKIKMMHFLNNFMIKTQYFDYNTFYFCQVHRKFKLNFFLSFYLHCMFFVCLFHKKRLKIILKKNVPVLFVGFTFREDLAKFVHMSIISTFDAE